MTYHVNLLLDDERRSASRFNVAMVLRVSIMLGIGMILLVTMMLFVAGQEVSMKVAKAQAKWDHLKPQYSELQSLRRVQSELRASSRQIESCRLSRLTLGAELAQLQTGVPEEIQLTALRINQLVGNQKSGAASARNFEMHLSGKVSSDNPKGNVDKLIAYLSSSAYTGRVESVTVPNNGFRKETVRVSVTETRTDWYFELVCKYRPRSFE